MSGGFGGYGGFWGVWGGIGGVLGLARRASHNMDSEGMELFMLRVGIALAMGKRQRDN